jgi:Ala-tRNA(Pro) deacylase
MTNSIFNQIVQFLKNKQVPFTIKEHAPTPTSQDSARERNESINIGAKALLVKSKHQFHLCVIPANLKLDTKKVKKLLKSNKLRFATKEELFDLTGLKPGSVPPFGHILGIDMIIDQKQFLEEKIAFNAGSLTKSIIMKSKDFKQAIEPKIEDISQEIPTPLVSDKTNEAFIKQ